MSNNLLSQFPLSDRQMVQIEHVSNSLTLPVSETPMRILGHMPNNNPSSQHFAVSDQPTGSVEPVSSNPMFWNATVTSNEMGAIDPRAGASGLSSSWASNQQDGVMLSNATGEKPLLPSKRKAEVGPMLNNSAPQQPLVSNKRVAHTGPAGNPPGFLQPSSAQKKSHQMQTKLISPAVQNQPAANRKIVRNESMSSKSGAQRPQTSKRQTAQVASASKFRNESSESVRSKMRESLAAALALVSQNQGKSAHADKNQGEPANTRQAPSEPNAGVASNTPCAGNAFPSKESKLTSETIDGQVAPNAVPSDRGQSHHGNAFQEFQYVSVLPDDDVPFGENFFAKDELLQGNGLSWAFDFDMQVRDLKEGQDNENPNSVKEEASGGGGKLVNVTPEDLAFKIEAELFKLFGGVNKKYKEKGRSLLFNLKDRNNPELRERVMSGEISPERLCSMSAEELASKELSQWRMAKAEELAQMVVLPDTNVDVRRLVKKTHKGEYQVEVEHDDGIAAEVSAGTSQVIHRRPRNEGIPNPSLDANNVKERDDIAGRDNSISEKQDLSGSLVIPSDGTDLMQGMTVDEMMVDELKDTAFLPPIVSLDEFMESLDSEPPFEHLPADSEQRTTPSQKGSPKVENNSVASDSVVDAPRGSPSSKKADKVNTREDVVAPLRSTARPSLQRKLSPANVPKVQYLWEGTLQLSVSSTVVVGGLFRSGEKTSTKEWPNSLEIKGRVRLDAFEKFLQDLPMSRTRAVMVLHLVLKDKSSETERANLTEAVASYVVDERLGFAEPHTGVELYLCPPNARIINMLTTHIVKDHPEMVNTIDNGLIGVVVWRRAHLSNAISPNSSSHHKHSLKKQPFTLRREQEKHPDVNILSKAPVSHNVPHSEDDDDDDDVPPGFGPAVARPTKDDDDLPEFNFSSDINRRISRPPSQTIDSGLKLAPKQSSKRQGDRARELIQKYGQLGSTDPDTNVGRGVGVGVGIGFEPWNEDDDDIPEWRPQAPQQVAPPHQLPGHGVLRSHVANQHLVPAAHTQSPRAPTMPVNWLNNAPSQSPLSTQPPPLGARWVPPPAPYQDGRRRNY